MKERPILFSGPMVRAILDGRKTQTRRVVTDGRAWCNPQAVDRWEQSASYPIWWKMAVGQSRRIIHCGHEIDGGHIGSKRCPYGVPGDRLWVRETFALIWPNEYGPPEDPRDNTVEYRADGDTSRLPGQWPSDMRGDPDCPKWRPSIFMPRWASRITLEVTAVRVERVREITPDDAAAEGCGTVLFCEDDGTRTPLIAISGDAKEAQVNRFRDLWDSINGKRAGCAWADNPWVWVVEFRRVTP